MRLAESRTKRSSLSVRFAGREGIGDAGAGPESGQLGFSLKGTESHEGF